MLKSQRWSHLTSPSAAALIFFLFFPHINHLLCHPLHLQSKCCEWLTRPSSSGVHWGFLQDFPCAHSGCAPALPWGAEASSPPVHWLSSILLLAGRLTFLIRSGVHNHSSAPDWTDKPSSHFDYTSSSLSQSLISPSSFIILGFWWLFFFTLVILINLIYWSRRCNLQQSLSIQRLSCSFGGVFLTIWGV